MYQETNLRHIIKDCKENANKHGWRVEWKIQNADVPVSIGEALCLIHSEVSEALEAYRKNDKEKFSEEIADICIRIFHLCGDVNVDLVSALEKKMEINRFRPFRHGKTSL